MTVDHRELWKRFTDAINDPNDAAFDSLVTEDYVEEWPQSGEVLRGRTNFLRMLRAYPEKLSTGGVDPESTRVAVQEAKWVMTRAFTLVRVDSSGDIGTVIFRTHYPDGSWWWIIGTYQLRGDRIARRTTFFAPEYERPEWRQDLTEKTKND